MVRLALNFDMDDDLSTMNTSLMSDDSGIHSEDSLILEDDVESHSPCKRPSAWYGDDDYSPPKRRAFEPINLSDTGLKNTRDECNENEATIEGESRTHSLPTVSGKHPDLKAISSKTMAKLLQNEYSQAVEEFVIVDCRYPYEYDGGHIEGAINIWNRDTMSLKLCLK